MSSMTAVEGADQLVQLCRGPICHMVCLPILQSVLTTHPALVNGLPLRQQLQLASLARSLLVVDDKGTSLSDGRMLQHIMKADAILANNTSSKKRTTSLKGKSSKRLPQLFTFPIEDEMEVLRTSLTTRNEIIRLLKATKDDTTQPLKKASPFPQ